MIEPLQLLWFFGIGFMVLTLVVLVEVQRSVFRRENEVMFGTPQFEARTKALGLLPEEIEVLEKLVRFSRYENKDAILNTAALFEAAVSNYYDYKKVEKISDDKLLLIEKLRKKLNFTAENPLATIYSTRQYNRENFVDLIINGDSKVLKSKIFNRTEKYLEVDYDETVGGGRSLVGKFIGLRWTRPEDAVYTAKVDVLSYEKGLLKVSHATTLDKKQLRRWVREPVEFPVEVSFLEKNVQGVLLDLSAGGILIGIPIEFEAHTQIQIRFELPSFGEENVKIEILRSLGHKNPKYPDFYFYTASFVGTFGWTQERVLQYIFEVHKQKKRENKGESVSN